MVMTTALDVTLREDLAEKALALGDGRHHAAVSPTLIFGEGRVNLREAHHPDDFATIHRDAVSLPGYPVQLVPGGPLTVATGLVGLILALSLLFNLRCQKWAWFARVVRRVAVTAGGHRDTAGSCLRGIGGEGGGRGVQYALAAGCGPG